MKPNYWCFMLTCVLAAVAEQMQILNCESKTTLCCGLQNVTIETAFGWTSNGRIAQHCLYMSHVKIQNNSIEFFQRLPATFIELRLEDCRVPQLLLPSSVLKLTIWNPVDEYELIIPDGVTHTLQFLRLSQLTTLPRNLDKLCTLQSLTIRDSSLENIFLDTLTNLQSLEVVRSGLETIQAKGDLRMSFLDQLNLSENNLSELDMHRWDFPALNLLELKQNRLTNVPIGIGNFFSLGVVDLSYNFIQHLNMHDFHGLNNLTALTLQSNQLFKFYSDNLVILPQLRYLTLERNQLELLDFTNITIPSKNFKLNVACNRLSEVLNWPVGVIDWEVSLIGNPWKCDFLEDTFARVLTNLMPNKVADKLEQYCELKVRGICCRNNLDSETTFNSTTSANVHHCKPTAENDRFDILKVTYMRKIRANSSGYPSGISDNWFG